MNLALLKQQKAERLDSRVKVEVEVNLKAVKLEAMQERENWERTGDLKASVKQSHTIKFEAADPIVPIISAETIKQEEQEPIIEILDNIFASTSSQAYDSIPCASKDKARSPPVAPRKWTRSLDKGKGRMIEQNVHSPRYRPYIPSPLSRPPLVRSPSSSPPPSDPFLPLSPLSLNSPEVGSSSIECSTSIGRPLFRYQSPGTEAESSQPKTRTPQCGKDTSRAATQRRGIPRQPPKPPPVYRQEKEENWENPFKLPSTSIPIIPHRIHRFTTTYDWPVYQLPPPSPPVIKPFGSREKEEESRDEMEIE